MKVTVSDERVSSTGLTEKELATEYAIEMYQREKLTLGQAARLAGMSRFEFQRLLGSREIPLTLDVDDFEQDLATLRQLGLL